MTWNLNSFGSSMVDATVVTPRIWNPYDQTHQDAKRTKVAVDEKGNDVGHFTGQFKLVTAMQLVTGVECAADAVGLDIQRESGFYRNGKMLHIWSAPDQKIELKPGREVTPWLLASNGYGQGTGLKLTAAGCDGVCKNGMIFGALAQVTEKRKHQGDFRVYDEFCLPVLQQFTDKVEVMRLELEVMKATEIKSNNPVFELIKDETPERYHQRLGQAIRENVREFGWTALGALQGVTEVGSHEMRGQGGMAWTERVTQLITAAVEAEGVELPTL